MKARGTGRTTPSQPRGKKSEITGRPKMKKKERQGEGKGRKRKEKEKNKEEERTNKRIGIFADGMEGWRKEMALIKEKTGYSNIDGTSTEKGRASDGGQDGTGRDLSK